MEVHKSINMERVMNTHQSSARIALRASLQPAAPMKKNAFKWVRPSILSAALVMASIGANAVTVLTTFETPEVGGSPPSTGSAIFGLSPTAFAAWMTAGGVPGWSINAGGVNIGEVGSALPGSAGQQFLFLSAGDVATYTFSGLTTGAAYHLLFSFDYSAASPAAAPNVGTFSVNNGSSSVITSTVLARDTPTASNANTYFSNLGQATSQSLNFVATDTTLAFAFAVSAGAGTGSNHIALDNVNVGIQALPVPEPASYATLLAGLIAIGYVARRRRPNG